MTTQTLTKMMLQLLSIINRLDQYKDSPSHSRKKEILMLDSKISQNLQIEKIVQIKQYKKLHRTIKMERVRIVT